MSNNPEYYNKGKDHVWHPYSQAKIMAEPIKVAKASGSKIYQEDGTILIDGVASWWSAALGHNHPYIADKIAQQLKIMPHFMFAGAAHEPAYNLCHRLADLTGLDRVFLTDSGSTAVETALKIACQYWKNKKFKYKNNFISFTGAYHGDTMGCMSLCDPISGMHKLFRDYMPRQYSINIPNDEYSLAEFENIISGLKNTIAAVIIEPLVQGAGGMKFFAADILAAIYNICKKHEIIFIADEIMTGFGRTGNMFACNEAGIVPDIMCVGKALTGGFITLGAVAVKNDIYEAFYSDELDHALMSGPTYMGNPLACAAANAVLDLFEKEDILAKVDNIEKIFYAKFKNLHKRKNIADVRIKGAIAAIEIKNIDYDMILKIRESAIKKGAWLRPFSNIIPIIPAFNISDCELFFLCDTVNEIIEELL